jgi:RNA polymerase sigma factor (sigma-70 family)
MVLGVCRHVLRQEQDAEDAFQATFWVLARNAGSVRNKEALAGWLHGVAYRTAVFARRSAARRRMHEGKVKAMPQRDPSWESAWREVQALLDEEIGRLPAKCRAAFVLCHLEGHSRAEAARQLGLKEGTVSSRLDQARKRLQRRLSQRGVVLTAVLGAAALGNRAGAAVPARLARVTVQTALGHTAGPAAVAGLVRGVAPTLLGTKLKVMAAVLAAAGVLAAGAGALAHRVESGPPAPASAAETPTLRKQAAGREGPARGKQAAPTPSADGAVVVKGRVLGPDRQPVAGANLLVWTDATKKAEGVPVGATTGEDGRFRLTVARADLGRNAKVVATGKGQGPDWVKLKSSSDRGEIILRLGKDDVPVDGRILDLEGRPIAGASIEVRWLEKRAEGGGLGPWIEMWQAWARGKEKARVAMTGIHPRAVGVPTALTTGKDGGFRLTGLGRERVVHLALRGPDIQHADLTVITRPGVDGLPAKYHVYDATFKHLAGPTKPIVGTVRDKRTGKPIPGVRVECGNARAIGGDPSIRATTDAKGRYRLTGLGKCEEYYVAAEGPSHFNLTRLDVKDTPGLEPITVDFELERGLVLRGRLTDQEGKPVRGSVHYAALAANPNLKDFTSLNGLKVGVTPMGQSGPDGSFAVLTIPGPGLLFASADEADRYSRAQVDGPLLQDVVRANHHPSQSHAVVRIDPSEKDPKSTARDIALEPGRTRTGTVLGPDGQPLAGVLAGGLAPVVRTYGTPRKLETARFTATGLSPREPRALVFYHHEKQLSKLVRVKADEGGPLTVRLEPLGGITGRVLDANGRPWAGLTVLLELNRSVLTNKDVPFEFLISETPFTPRAQVTTDKDGRFQFKGVVPGMPYNLFVSEGGPGTRVAYHAKDLSAESGKTRDLGDLKGKLPPKGEKE